MIRALAIVGAAGSAGAEPEVGEDETHFAELAIGSSTFSAGSMSIAVGASGSLEGGFLLTGRLALAARVYGSYAPSTFTPTTAFTVGGALMLEVRQGDVIAGFGTGLGVGNVCCRSIMNGEGHTDFAALPLVVSGGYGGGLAGVRVDLYAQSDVYVVTANLALRGWF